MTVTVIVEVVSDAACQPSDTLHLLRLLKALFEPRPLFGSATLFGDVPDESESGRLSVVSNTRALDLGGERLAVEAQHPALRAGRRSTRLGCRTSFPGGLAIFRVDIVEQARPDQIRRRLRPEHPHTRRVDVTDCQAGRDQDALGRMLDYLTEPLLTLQQLLPGADVRRNLLDDAEQGHWRVRHAQRRGGDGDPDRLAVLPDVPLLPSRRGALSADDGLSVPVIGRPVVGMRHGGIRHPEQLLPGVAGNIAVALIHANEAAVEIDHVHADGRLFERRAEHGLALPERL